MWATRVSPNRRIDPDRRWPWVDEMLVGYRRQLPRQMTFDVSVIRHGEPLRRHTSVFQRYELALPMLDVESVGAGGGSLAWMDASDRLNVGPQSAGASPGPVCYGQGNEVATVTDADVTLGFIDPTTFLGGQMTIDGDASARALGRTGEPLGLDANEAAAGVNRLVEWHQNPLGHGSSLLVMRPPARAGRRSTSWGGASRRESGSGSSEVP